MRPDAVELLPRLAEAFDEPFADSSALPTYLVSELAAGTVKVALSGEGGDELFGGYYTYVADTLAPRVGPRRVGAAAAGRRAAELLRPRSASTTRPSASRARRTCRRSSATTAGRRSSRRRRAPRCSTAAAARVDPLDVYRARYAETEGADELARLQDVDIGIYLADDLLVKTDRASMAHSLEARVPFCDQVVAELALALPRPMKVRGLSKKRLLRQAVATLLPREIVRAPQAGLLDPGRRVAARRPGAVRARGAVAGPPARAGLLRPGGRHRA